jgi:hypothetical protein
MDWVAVAGIATGVLALATFALAFLTFRMARETTHVATATRELATAAKDQVAAGLEQLRISNEELALAKSEALAVQEPQISLELVEGQTIGTVRQREGMNLFYIWVNLRLVNNGGPVVIHRLHVTGAPKVETRPHDIYGFLPTGGRMEFSLRFDVGNAPENLRADASIPVRARAQRQKDWRETLFYVNVRFARSAGEQFTGWYARVSQPMTILGPDI